MEALIVVVLGLLAIVAAATLGARLGVASPLLLVGAGIAVSLLPFVPAVDIDPEWILAGVLPPLLYSASVSMPTMDFRREFGAISGLSVILVLLSAVVLGFFFSWVLPGLDIWWGIALGAIVSPTDAVATSIVKRVGVSPRVVAILDGESLLNDATALVLLRTAIVGAAASISFWGVVGDFAFAVVVAVVIGYAVGRLNLIARRRVSDATVNTLISFTVPFLASIPAELLGASGLVAAVVAGLVTGHRGPRVLTPQHRLSDTQNWLTVELVLEGAVFLTMGLELAAIVGDVVADHSGLVLPVLVAAGALALSIGVRAAYVTPLLMALRRRSERGARIKPHVEGMRERLDDQGADFFAQERGRRELEEVEGTRRPLFGRRRVRAQAARMRRVPTQGRVEHLRTRLRRLSADIDYLQAAPLGWREGAVVVWAGMRGAVTLAAAQTLPADTPERSLLILIAFVVAVSSLLLQGGTLPTLVRVVRPAGSDEGDEAHERERVRSFLADVAAGVDPQEEPTDSKRHRVAVIQAQRDALLDAHDDGVFSARALNAALQVLDADQITLELRGNSDQ